MRRSFVTVAAAVLVWSATACAGDDGSAPLSTSLTELQRTASTVERPDTPPPCDPDDVATWTARTEAAGSSVSAVIRLRNDGPVWCEVDISSSDRFDRFVEPSVWLDPGAGADLVVGDSLDGCDAPRHVLEVEVGIGGESRIVRTAAVVPCDWSLVAFYPTEPPQAPCDVATIDVVRLDELIVLRNGGFASCVLGELLTVEGATLGASEDTRPAIDWLAGGDVVAFPVTSGGSDCEPVVVMLTFDAGDVSVEGSSCETVGPGVAFYDGAAGPLGALAPGDLDAAMAALDPFTAPAG